MRLSRNRNWGNPHLVQFIKRLGHNAKKVGWNGLLVGDMAQPRGGPMLSGHSSHQVGLDVDVWFTPMPDHVQSREEREFASATNVVAPDLLDVDAKVWTHTYTELIRTAAQDPAVTRIFVNAAIKKALCREAGADRDWLFKVRPWWGHAEHFHVRIACPADSPECKPQPPPEASDGCGQELDFWFKESTLHPIPPLIPAQAKTAIDVVRLAGGLQTYRRSTVRFFPGAAQHGMVRCRPGIVTSAVFVKFASGKRVKPLNPRRAEQHALRERDGIEHCAGANDNHGGEISSALFGHFH